MLAVVACSGESTPQAPTAPAPEATAVDSPVSQGSAGPDADVSAGSSASSGDSVSGSGSAGFSGSSGDSGASAGQAAPPDNVVYGTIAWPSVVTPPPHSVLEIELLDVSWQDAPAEYIIGQVILDPGEGPVDFYLEIDPADIRPENTYAVQATLSDPRGNLMYINDVAYDVLTQGQPNYVDVELVAAFDLPSAATRRPRRCCGRTSTPSAPAGKPAVATAATCRRFPRLSPE